MSKRKIFLASILVAASLTATGCGGGGGGGSSSAVGSGSSSSVGSNTNSGNVGGVINGFNTTTNLVVGEDKFNNETGEPIPDGKIDAGTEVPYYAARQSATNDAPPPVPVISR